MTSCDLSSVPDIGPAATWPKLSITKDDPKNSNPERAPTWLVQAMKTWLSFAYNAAP